MKKLGKNSKLYLIGITIGAIVFGITTVVADTIINSTNVSYKTTTVKAALDDLYGLTADDIWKKIYPVGAIYISTSSTSPATLFGGTWEAFGQGRTLVGFGSGTDSSGTTKTFVAGSEGGEYEHKLTEKELPRYAWLSYKGNITDTTGGVAVAFNGGTSYGASTQYNGMGQTFSLLPPYKTVYMWKRTA